MNYIITLTQRLKNIRPENAIGKIKNVNKFIGSVLYQIADKIVYLYEVISNKCSSWREYPQDLTQEFKGELALQYYKLLEQIPNYKYDDDFANDYNKGFTSQELIIRSIDVRIIIETIRMIKITELGEPIVIAHFDEEIENKTIYGRTYDEENLKMIFNIEKRT